MKIKEELKPDYIVATFDRKAPTFRHKEFDEYWKKYLPNNCFYYI